MEWGAFYLLLLALHSLCIDGYYYCFVFQCITNFALAYRKRGRTDFLLARMVYPIAHRGTHPRNTRGLYTWLWLYCFAFWHLPDGCEVGRRNTGILLGFGSDSLADSLTDVYYCNIWTGYALSPESAWTVTGLACYGLTLSHSYSPIISPHLLSPLGVLTLSSVFLIPTPTPHLWIVRCESFIHSSSIIFIIR